MVGDGLDWVWVFGYGLETGESLHMAGVGFKMSRSELNLSGSGCERAENKWQWVENE